jgi:outer membrane biosynthesis protein TonB
MNTFIRTGVLLALVAGGSMAGAACVTTQAKAPVERPALDVPPVPPRVIDPAPTPPPPVPEPVADLPAPPAAARPRPQPQREPARSDPKPETPAVEPPQATPPAQQSAVPPLRTGGSADAAQAARQIREIKDRAQKLLDTTDYRALTSEQRAQYDNAKRFIAEAEDALKAANFEFARGVAEKAERLARELQGR